MAKRDIDFYGYILMIRKDSDHGNEVRLIHSPSHWLNDTRKIIKRLEAKGYEHAIGGYATEEHALEIAAKDYDAYPHACAICHQFAPTTHVRGQRLDEDRRRWSVFNARICEQCLSDGKSAGELKVRFV